MTPAELDVLPSPQFWRRVSCSLYEQLVLLGVIAFTFLVFYFYFVNVVALKTVPLNRRMRV